MSTSFNIWLESEIFIFGPTNMKNGARNKCSLSYELKANNFLKNAKKQKKKSKYSDYCWPPAHTCAYLVQRAYIKFMNTFSLQQHQQNKIRRTKTLSLNVPASREHDLHIHLSLLDCIIIRLVSFSIYVCSRNSILCSNKEFRRRHLV